MAKVYLLGKTISTIDNKDSESLNIILNKLNFFNNKVQNISSNGTSYRISEPDKKEIEILYGHIYFTFYIMDAKTESIDEFRKYISEITLNKKDKKMLVTMNVENLLKFFNIECCKQKSEDLNDIADQMLDICLSETPNLFKDAGAPCTFENCDKKDSCGEKRKAKIKQIIKTY